MSSTVPAALARARVLAGELQSLIEDLDPSVLLAGDARDAVEVFSRIKDLGAHGELLAAGAVAARDAWKASGEPTAAHWLSRTSGVGLCEVRDVLSTAARLASAPAVDEAARSGSLSRTECVAIADASAVAGVATDSLLSAVGQESISELRDRCLAAKAAARDPEAQHRALHAQRSLRTRTDAEGAFCLSWRDTPERGAAFMAILTPFTDAEFKRART